MLGGLARLVDRSLVRREGGAEPRFSMLETIGEFGLELLAASDEAAAVRDAHAAWASDLAVRAGTALDRRMEPDTLRRVETELDNVRAAAGRPFVSFRATGPARLAGAMLFPWYLSGDLREGRAWAERSLASAPERPTLVRGSAAFTAGHLAHYLGDDVAAVSWLRQAIRRPQRWARSMPLDGPLMATVAVLGAACGASEPATRLMGATGALLATSGDSFRLPERDVYERAAGDLRSGLGAARYDLFAAEGRGMPDDAITADVQAIIAAARSVTT